MSNLFSAYAEEQLENQTIPTILTGKLNPFEFITSTDKLYLREDPTPFQRVVIKTFYGLWPLYPPDQEEASIIRVLRENWKISIDLECLIPIDTLILVLGRRSTKSTIMSYFATVAMYELLHLENPQLYYHIRERHPIHITHVAAAGKQAEEVFSFTSNNLRRAEFFRPYIDFDKDNSTELRLFSPFDLTLNRQIDYRNSLIPRGKMKESRLPGSLLIESITTSAATARGKAIILLMMSEYAHFQRAKQDLNKSDEQIASENPQTDYAILKALVPSVKDFVPDGKVVLESSPREKGGEHYHQYCIGGGMEQENFENITPEPGYQVIQAATWEARPTITYESLVSEFRKDPVGANMEWGGHFGNPSGQFISEALIHAVPIAVKPLIRVNPGTYRFVLAIDPGGKAKKKKADTYAMAWGHSEGGPIEKNVHYYVDGMHGFDAQVRNLGMGKIEKIPVNPNEVVGYLVDLINDLGGKNHIMEIVYDQWESSAPIATLQSFGMPAFETTFTNEYKAGMYQNFLERVQEGRVHMYGIDVGLWVERWKLEMKFLQQNTKGRFTFYHHPASGPVQTDDFADVVAQLVHRLVLRVAPTKDSVTDARKHGTGPIRMIRTIKPTRGGPLWGGTNIIRTRH